MVEASLDTWTSIFLFASIQGLFLAFALFFYQKGAKSSRLLLVGLMLSFSFVLAYWTVHNRVYPQIEGNT
jgi:hypothetical protein